MKAPPLPESAIQHQVRTYLAALGIDAIHVPNGTHLAGDKVARIKQSNALKRAGVLPGMADLILFDRRVRRVGFMEVKVAAGRLSPAQERFADLAAVWGWPFAVVRSANDAQAALAEWGWR